MPNVNDIPYQFLNAVSATTDSTVFYPEHPFTNDKRGTMHTLMLSGSFSGGTVSTYLTLDPNLGAANWVLVDTHTAPAVVALEHHFYAAYQHFQSGAAGAAVTSFIV